MSRNQKRLINMIINPVGWRIEDIKVIANRHGIKWRQHGGSHCQFIRMNDGKTLPIPVHRPIKPVYIKKFIKLVKGE